MARSEPNTILEINEANSDNFILVIPRLPTAQFLGSVFQHHTKPNPVTQGTTGTPVEECDAISQQQIRREHNLDLTNFKLFISDVTLPNVSVSKVEIGTQFATLSRASKINFNDLNTTMMVSENFLNYRAILYWLYALHNPEEFNNMSGRKMIENYMTDIHLIITNNHREKVAEFKFLDAFPQSLGDIPFSYKTADNLSVPVVWAHSGMFPTDNYVLKYV